MTTKLSPTVPMAARVEPDVATAAPASAVRLSLTSALDRRGVVDGAWWPRSRDASAELPGLVAAVRLRLGRGVVRVGVGVTTWTDIPRRLQVQGRIVKVGWFASIDPLVVSLTIAGVENITLLVIPPDTPAAIASNALALATVSRGRIRPADILSTAREVARAESEQRTARWENEGGQVRG